ncbi:hypothetical protein O181_076750 [Austropuccinia psidii MF-1]|uniref:Uncharacterized protein n=1 Tax=Austropuccinia psidii MF-1 TaxID=1389203 RepID=A0A9Q3FGU4_9BASI|nr:hypothetical protein [Austropuccinia psidii MF-1]
MWTGSMHMESQPGWPALDLSCIFVLISPQLQIEARELLCCINDPWSEGANCPSIQLPINATHQGAQRAMARLPFSPTSTGPSGSFIGVSILTAIADVVSMCKLT